MRGLSKSFAGKPLYTNFNLDLPRSKIVSIFGPNGCGKSTLMNMIAGLVPLDAGEILFDGKALKDTKIGYVFQNYRDALFPWITAWDNIAYPLRRGGMKEADVRGASRHWSSCSRSASTWRATRTSCRAARCRRCASCASLATEPEVLFLDEPFSALDFEMTLFIRAKLQEAHMQTGTTMVIVSHDLEDAVFLADHILLLTRRPTRIAELVTFEMPRPRPPEAVSDGDSCGSRRIRSKCSAGRWRRETTALALDTYDLTKRFGAFTALDSVSLRCGPARCMRCSARTAPARARW